MVEPRLLRNLRSLPIHCPKRDILAFECENASFKHNVMKGIYKQNLTLISRICRNINIPFSFHADHFPVKILEASSLKMCHSLWDHKLTDTASPERTPGNRRHRLRDRDICLSCRNTDQSLFVPAV